MNIGRLVLRNRFVRSATFDALADEDGGVTEGSLALFSKLAEGGASLIISGFAYVSKQGQPVPRQYGIHCDKLLPALERLVQGVHAHGALVAAQIVHCGGNSPYLNSLGQVALAPSAIPDRQPQRTMTELEIDAVIDEFVDAAGRAQRVGFDVVQLHGAHGYLFSQFLSPLTNHRTDRWGGSLENRMRFHLETIRRLRGAVGASFPLAIKFGIADDTEGGLSVEEGIHTLKAMAAAGIDMVEISGGIGTGKLAPVRIVGNAETEVTYFRERAVLAKRAVTIPVAAVGGIRRLETAEAMIASGDVDLIALSRPFVREPDLVNRWESGNHERSRCISCGKCTGRVVTGKALQCVEELN